MSLWFWLADSARNDFSQLVNRNALILAKIKLLSFVLIADLLEGQEELINVNVFIVTAELHLVVIPNVICDNSLVRGMALSVLKKLLQQINLILLVLRVRLRSEHYLVVFWLIVVNYHLVWLEWRVLLRALLSWPLCLLPTLHLPNEIH